MKEDPFLNPINPDKVAQNPGLLPYAHTAGGAVIKPEDTAKTKGRSILAMRQQTDRQMNQLYEQMEVLAKQAKLIADRKEISERIYDAAMGFEPIISENKMKILRNPSLEWIGKNSDQERKGWLFAGRLVPEKGIIKLIENWPENENLDIAGDGPLINEVKQIISDKINIRLIGTYPPGDNTIFTKYEGLMFPSSWLEGSPLVVIDSLSTGTPVICTDQSAAKEQIEITGGGVVIKGGLSKEKISDAQLRIRKDFTILSELGSKAVRNDFSIKKWVSDLELYFSEALA